MTTRREFLSTGSMTATAFMVAGLTDKVEGQETAESVKRLSPPKRPVIVTLVTGDQSVEEAYRILLPRRRRGVAH